MPLPVALWQGTPQPAAGVEWAMEALATAAASAAKDGARLLVLRSPDQN